MLPGTFAFETRNLGFIPAFSTALTFFHNLNCRFPLPSRSGCPKIKSHLQRRPAKIEEVNPDGPATTGSNHL